MSDFSSRIDDFLAELFRLHPTFATAIGQHDHDDRWPDLTTPAAPNRPLSRKAGSPSSAP